MSESVVRPQPEPAAVIDAELRKHLRRIEMEKLARKIKNQAKRESRKLRGK